jgi:hypothetical protein
MLPPVAFQVTVAASAPPSLMCAVAVNACDAPDASVTLAGATVTDSSETGSGPPSEPEQPATVAAASNWPARKTDL